MKFSVLLPTRNRLELLRYAIETVRRQDYEDWEIIVSDNDSEQDIAGYVESIADPRIRYFRTDSFVPVTDNWNNALEKSVGDYVLMLGDDDCLMQHCLSTLFKLIGDQGKPDFLYTNALLYAYPGVVPGEPEGYLQPIGYAEFLRSVMEPFWLDREKARRHVRDAMNFRMTYGYNMQYAVIGRDFIKSLQGLGKFFQSPYPDFYAMNMMMLKAKRILVCPYPLVTIGISPKSFGYYYFNRQEQAGTTFLKNIPDPGMAQRLEKVILPGTDMNTSWLIAMETVSDNCGTEVALRANYGRYRRLQVLRVFSWAVLDRENAKLRLNDLWGKLGFLEKALSAGLSLTAHLTRLLPQRRRLHLINWMFVLTGVSMKFFPKQIRGHYQNILEVHERVDPLASRVSPVEFRSGALS